MKESQKDNWIQNMIKVTQWDDIHSSGLEELNMRTVHSLLIDNNPQFQELKQIIDNYNMSVRQSSVNKTALNHASLREKFATQLYKMLSELTMMKNSETQLKCLEQVYKWAKSYEFQRKQERPTTATTRASRPTTGKTRPTSGISVVVPTGINKARMRYDKNAVKQIEDYNREISDMGYEDMFDDSKNGTTRPSGIAQTILQGIDYREKSRTIHSQYEVPQKRLKQYKRKCLQLEQEPVIMSKQLKKPVQAVIPKPIVEPPKADSATPLLEEGVQKPPEGEQPLQEEPVPEGQQPMVAVDEEDLGLQGIGGEDDIEVVDLQEPVDKLAPKNRAYAQNYNPLEHNSLIAERKRAEENYNRKINEQRQQFEMVTIKNQWSKAKSRWEQDESRKRQSSKVDDRRRVSSNTVRHSATNHIDFSGVPVFETGRPMVHKTYNYEDTIDAAALKMIKYNNLESVKLHPSQQVQFLKIQKSNTIAERPKTGLTSYAQAINKPRQFTDILAAAKKKVGDEMEEEILSIKECLAKHKVPAEMSTIRQGIGVVDFGETPEGVILGLVGKQLPSNPFIKVAKKKKKKKKK